MARSTITSKGQITLPKIVREALGVGPGDRVAFVIRDDGSVTVEPDTVHLPSMRGILKPTARGVTVEAMNATIRKAGSKR